MKKLLLTMLTLGLILWFPLSAVACNERVTNDICKKRIRNFRIVKKHALYQKMIKKYKYYDGFKRTSRRIKGKG